MLKKIFIILNQIEKKSEYEFRIHKLTLKLNSWMVQWDTKTLQRDKEELKSSGKWIDLPILVTNFYTKFFNFYASFGNYFLFLF